MVKVILLLTDFLKIQDFHEKFNFDFKKVFFFLNKKTNGIINKNNNEENNASIKLKFIIASADLKSVKIKKIKSTNNHRYPYNIS